MSAWEEICRHGDDETAVRRALLDEFDLRWPSIGKSIRAQLLEQGASLADALAATEQCRHIFRTDAADQAPRVLDGMAASAAPTH
jgi:hypothetical protein